MAITAYAVPPGDFGDRLMTPPRPTGTTPGDPGAYWPTRTVRVTVRSGSSRWFTVSV